MAESDRELIPAPRPLAAPAPFRFPVVATVAPVAASVALWLITGSLFALLFAVLGPITALAGLVDSRIGARRSARKERERFLREADRARALIAHAHELETEASSDRSPPASWLVLRSGADPYRWRAESSRPIAVVVGVGVVRSSVTLDRRSEVDAQHPLVGEVLAELETMAHDRDGHVLVDARLGIGIVGIPRLTAAVARAIAAQLAWALSPRTYWVDAPAGEHAWVVLLPHPARPPSTPLQFGGFRFGRVGSPDADTLVATAERREDLPSGCEVVISTSGSSGPAIVQHPDREQRRAIRLELLSREEAAEWAVSARADAEREGLVDAAHNLPDSIALGDLGDAVAGVAPNTRSGLSASFCVGVRGPVQVDLVAHGPHAVVGGTTGSGKSELLIAWVLALCSNYSPDKVNFLLVDFKGGASFGALARLPHTVGIVTDLDPDQAARALTSLKAELKFRERALADAGVADVERVAGLPRLVIVVDEFATMVSEHPDLHALFADIAARGRSLGVHLVLCTQRPAGVIRDSVLANTDLRISLRVNNRADSEAVVGCADAAALPSHPRGRAILRVAGDDVETVQIALADPDDAEHIAAGYSLSAPIRSPWCESLPGRVPLDDLPLATPHGGSVVFGLSDLPHEQRIGVASWSPETAGHILVLGAAGSGKTTALETIAARSGRVLWVPQSLDAAWDAVCQLEMDPSSPTIVILDDIDSMVARFSADYRAVFVERLARVLRDGPARGIHLVFSAQRMTAEAASLATLAPDRLMLKHPTRYDWVLAGGESHSFPSSLPPGGGLWHGDRVQVACGAPVRPSAERAHFVELDRSRPLAIVSARARALAGRLARLGEVVELGAVTGDVATALHSHGNLDGSVRQPAVILLGDVDDWQSRWGALGALRDRAQILFEGCSVADFRSLSRSREMPPLISELSLGDRAVGWLLNLDGTAVRARLPLD